MATKETLFDDVSRSRITELTEDRGRKNINSYHYENKCFADFQQYFLNNTPYEKSIRLNWDIDPAITFDQVKKTINETIKIEKDYKHASVVTFVQGIKQPNVKYIPAKMIKKDTSLVAPSLHFKVPKCEPNSIQRLNSGYVVDIREYTGHKFENNNMVKMKKEKSQDPFLLIPQFTCNTEGIIPIPMAIDRTDKNIYFLFLYNVFGAEAKVSVYFHSFLYEFDFASSITPSKPPVFKPRDINNSGCGVYNPKRKLMYNAIVKKEHPQLVAPIFDASHENAMASGSMLTFDRLNIFFSPRRRNWMNNKMVALPGFFSKDGSLWIPPVLHKDSVYNINTHCVSFLKKRTVLFSVIDKIDNSHFLVSGAFADLPEVKELNGHIKRIVYIGQMMVLDSKSEDYFKKMNPAYNNDDLSLLTDYDISLNKNPMFDRLVNILRTSKKNGDSRLMTEEKIFNETRKRSKSGKFYTSMKYVYDALFNKKENEKVSDADKRKSEDFTSTDSTDKKIKLECSTSETHVNDAKKENDERCVTKKRKSEETTTSTDSIDKTSSSPILPSLLCEEYI